MYYLKGYFNIALFLPLNRYEGKELNIDGYVIEKNVSESSMVEYIICVKKFDRYKCIRDIKFKMYSRYELNIGDKLENLKVIKVYEDGRLGLTPRGERKVELDTLEVAIMNYMEGNDGFMRFNDKSSPDEIATVFNSSNKNFKRALGVLIKKGLIIQNEEGTFLK